jgi:hypothetical protein
MSQVTDLNQALRQNNPYSIGFIFVFEEGDYLLNREDAQFEKSISDRYYTVEEDDTLSTIAFKAYGSSKWWWLIRDANDIYFGFDITVGQTLYIPDLNTAKANTLV